MDSLEDKLLEFISCELNKINLNLIFENVMLNYLVNTQDLILFCECLYFRELIIKHRKNLELSNYICILRDDTFYKSQMTFLYIINYCDKLYNKADSVDNLSMYI